MVIEVNYYSDDEKKAFENKNNKHRKLRKNTRIGGRETVIIVVVTIVIIAALVFLGLVQVGILKFQPTNTEPVDVKDMIKETESETKIETRRVRGCV